jgi:hypothetical protein
MLQLKETNGQPASIVAIFSIEVESVHETKYKHKYCRVVGANDFGYFPGPGTKWDCNNLLRSSGMGIDIPFV